MDSVRPENGLKLAWNLEARRVAWNWHAAGTDRESPEARRLAGPPALSETLSSPKTRSIANRLLIESFLGEASTRRGLKSIESKAAVLIGDASIGEERVPKLRREDGSAEWIQRQGRSTFRGVPNCRGPGSGGGDQDLILEQGGVPVVGGSVRVVDGGSHGGWIRSRLLWRTGWLPWETGSRIRADSRVVECCASDIKRG